MIGIGLFELIIIAVIVLVPVVIGIAFLVAVLSGRAAKRSNPNLTLCPDCGRQISKRASSCPHCGGPVSPDQSQ